MHPVGWELNANDPFVLIGVENKIGVPCVREITSGCVAVPVGVNVNGATVGTGLGVGVAIEIGLPLDDDPPPPQALRITTENKTIGNTDRSKDSLDICVSTLRFKKAAGISTTRDVVARISHAH